MQNDTHKDCTSPDELAGVLAHEMAHVTERHGLDNVLRQYTWSMVLRMLGSSDKTLHALAQVLVNTSFSRDSEREADSLGVERLLAASIHPEGLANFFGRLAKEGAKKGEGFTSYFSSHPDLLERKKVILQGGQNNPPQFFTPAMPADAWKELRELCSDTEKKKMPETM